jgi:hypothetical protein
MQTHAEYQKHLGEHLPSLYENPETRKMLENQRRTVAIMANLNLDPVIPVLQRIYSPVLRRKPRDPVCMLRALLLMTVIMFRGITKWVTETRSVSLFAVLTGFDPNDMPGIGTYYDFMRRIADSPWRKLCDRVVRRSTDVIRKHIRNFQGEKNAKDENRDPNQSESEKLANELLAHAEDPRPEGFWKTLQDFLILAGVMPSVKAGLMTLSDISVQGDGSVFPTAASPNGKPTCKCRSEGIFKCDHNRSYTSPTAAWCYDAAHDICIFGDRYYHIVTTQGGHDFPLIAHMPGGNESDYTFSLFASDCLLKCLAENGQSFLIRTFCGDGHHDAYAHYSYFAEKNIIPIIPLSESSKKVFVRLCGEKANIRFSEKGVPLCPGGVPMRHHQFNKRKRTHVYNCPVKRPANRGGKRCCVTHTDECPEKKDCAPDSTMGPFIYIKTDDDPRFFPPIPRNSKKFKDLMKERSASERLNAVIDNYNIEGAHRNADYSLIRLTLVNIVHHAAVRYAEAVKKASPGELSERVLAQIRGEPPAGCGAAA